MSGKLRPALLVKQQREVIHLRPLAEKKRIYFIQDALTIVSPILLLIVLVKISTVGVLHQLRRGLG